jgi:dTDP-glucose 4,6-dehydratase
MADSRFLICGGCGFIGSAFVRHLHRRLNEAYLLVFDSLTYAGSLTNLDELLNEQQIDFVRGDINSAADLKSLGYQRFELVINFAAETHVDRSFFEAERFCETNVLGLSRLVGFCRERDIPLLHISTDEVYGAAGEKHAFDETAPLNPSNPYAASKAAGDLIAMAAAGGSGRKLTIVRPCNNYGPRQYPEKLIPFMIHLARQDKPLPIYGDGRHSRCWIHVDDFADALVRMIGRQPTELVYNIGSTAEMENQRVAELIIAKTKSNSEIAFVADRPAHDQAYRLDSRRFEAEFGAIRRREFEVGLEETIDWYLSNPDIFARLDAAQTREFINRNYTDRE